MVDNSSWNIRFYYTLNVSVLFCDNNETEMLYNLTKRSWNRFGKKLGQKILKKQSLLKQAF